MARPLTPPHIARGAPLRRDAFTSPARSERTAAILGVALGLSFTICFATGLYSHLVQHPPAWFTPPARPAGLYRFSQGLHVATGIATIPLLLAKLWTVFPNLFAWPPFTGVAQAVERLFLLPLVGGSVFLLGTGVANINLWYPWPFSFPAAHYWTAWITVGALIVHIGAKVSTTRRALRRDPTTDTVAVDRAPVEGSRVINDAGRSGASSEAGADPPIGLSRRQLLATAFATSGLLTLATVGQTFAPLRKLALLAPRRPDTGPQGFPVNRTAAAADVTAAAGSAGYRLDVVGRRVPRPLSLTLAEIHALPQRRATLPIACVEGWSASRTWDGVPLRELLARAGVTDARRVRIESLQRRRAYRTSIVDVDQVADPDTLLATRVDGEPLHLDHGYPVRLVAPNRPGVHQTKWVTRVVVL